MRSLLILIFCIQYSFAQSSFVQKIKKKQSIDIETSLYSLYVEGEQVEARIMGFGLGADGYYLFSEKLKAEASIGVLLDSGSTKSVNTNEFKVRQGFDLGEAKLNWLPWTFFNIQGGVLSQGYYESDLLIGNVGMPAARESLFLTTGEVTFKINAEQSIPNNNTLATRVGSVAEGTPSLLMESIEVLWKNEWNDLRFLVGKFSFSELSSNVAFESQFLGNSVTGIGVNNSAFAYEFEGYSLLLRYDSNFDDWRFGVKGFYSHNKKAPNGRSDSFSALVRVGYNKVDFFLEAFKNESDASPGFYNSKSYGHNNREGFRAAIEYKSSRKWKTDLTFTKADLVRNDNVFQSPSVLGQARVSYFWGDAL
jgi:hypothetical protein